MGRGNSAVANTTKFQFRSAKGISLQLNNNL